MLTFSQRLVNFVLNIFAVLANSKFKFISAAVSKIHSQTVITKLMLGLVLIVLVSLQLFDNLCEFY